MIIIVDTNIVISACLDSQSDLYKILTSTTTTNMVDITIPDFALEEIHHRQTEICLKSKRSIRQFEHNLSVILGNLFIMPDEDLSQKIIAEAEKFTSSVDIDDTIFVAFALALDSLLWTGDLKLYRALRRKDFINIVLTKDLKQILKGL